MRFVENICVEKSAKPLESVNDNLSTHDLPKFQHFLLSAVKLKMLNDDVSNYDVSNCFLWELFSSLPAMTNNRKENG